MTDEFDLRSLAEAPLGRPLPDEHWTPESKERWRRALLAFSYGAGARMLKELSER